MDDRTWAMVEDSLTEYFREETAKLPQEPVLWPVHAVADTNKYIRDVVGEFYKQVAEAVAIKTDREQIDPRSPIVGLPEFL